MAGEEKTEIMVSLSIVMEDMIHMGRVSELLGMAAAGIAMEGFNATVSYMQMADDGTIKKGPS
jgi:hypothetical protein